jgi:hypothetical protein
LPFDSAECASTEEEVEIYIRGLMEELAAVPGRDTALVAGAKTDTETGLLVGERHFAAAVRAGVAVYFIAPEQLQFEQHGMDPSEGLAISLWPNSKQGGRFIGREFCRIAASWPQRVVLLYGTEKGEPSDRNHAIVLGKTDEE